VFSEYLSYLPTKQPALGSGTLIFSRCESVLRWKELDAKAHRMIGFNVSGPLQLPVRESITVKQTWDELAAIHMPQDHQIQLHLTHELYMCKILLHGLSMVSKPTSCTYAVHESSEAVSDGPGEYELL
jgi:hypothetical protein